MSETVDRALVLDGERQSGLAVARALGRHDVSVTVGSSSRLSLGRLSRFTDDSYHHPDPEADADAFVCHLTAFLQETSHDVVLPVSDATTTLLSRHKSALEATGTTVGTEDWERYVRTYDKARTFDQVDTLSVPSPETAAPKSLAAVDDLADTISYPAVVKPRSKTIWDATGRCHYVRIDDEWYVDGPSALRETYRVVLEDNPVLRSTGNFPLVQAYVPGQTTTTTVVAADGDVVTGFQEERVRTYPASGGNSTLLRSVSDPRMRAYAAEVVDALEWTGPAMVEFMRTPDDEFVLIEVNGRYWGSVPFAIECGVDVPWLHYRVLRGDRPTEAWSYPVGASEHRLLSGDLNWLAEQLRAGNLDAIPTFVDSCLSTSQTFVTPDDPAPMVGAIGQAAVLGTTTVARHCLGALGAGNDTSEE